MIWQRGWYAIIYVFLTCVSLIEIIVYFVLGLVKTDLMLNVVFSEFRKGVQIGIRALGRVSTIAWTISETMI